MGIRYANHGRSWHVKSDRNYEAEYGLALIALGYQVIEAAAYRKSKVAQADPCVVVAQFMPHPQSQVSGKTRDWTLDFAHPPTRTYVEIDGYNGGARGKGAHITWTGFHRDRERDRDLAFAGWRGLRYGPGHLADGEAVQRCAEEFVRFIQLVAGECEASA